MPRYFILPRSYQPTYAARIEISITYSTCHTEALPFAPRNFSSIVISEALLTRRTIIKQLPLHMFSILALSYDFHPPSAGPLCSMHTSSLCQFLPPILVTSSFRTHLFSPSTSHNHFLYSLYTTCPSKDRPCSVHMFPENCIVLNLYITLPQDHSLRIRLFPCNTSMPLLSFQRYIN